jgi:hypothetical protein
VILNAEAHQLIQEALADQGMKGRFYYKPLAALSRRLMSWGKWLQHQYDSTQTDAA